MADVFTKGAVVKFPSPLGEFLPQPLPGARIPVYVRSDGCVTLLKGEGLQEIGELAGVAYDGVTVRLYGSAVSDEMRASLANPLVFRCKA